MKPIEHVENHLSDKRKALLHSLRTHHWEVVGVDDADADWALDEKWLIESNRENRGVAMALWLFQYDGVHDGVDRVVATTGHDTPPDPYGGTPAIEFDTKRFDDQLDAFLAALHEYRLSGVLPGRAGTE